MAEYLFPTTEPQQYKLRGTDALATVRSPRDTITAILSTTQDQTPLAEAHLTLSLFVHYNGAFLGPWSLNKRIKGEKPNGQRSLTMDRPERASFHWRYDAKRVCIALPRGIMFLDFEWKNSDGNIIENIEDFLMTKASEDESPEIFQAKQTKSISDSTLGFLTEFFIGSFGESISLSVKLLKFKKTPMDCIDLIEGENLQYFYCLNGNNEIVKLNWNGEMISSVNLQSKVDELRTLNECQIVPFSRSMNEVLDLYPVSNTEGATILRSISDSQDFQQDSGSSLPFDSNDSPNTNSQETLTEINLDIGNSAKSNNPNKLNSEDGCCDQTFDDSEGVTTTMNNYRMCGFSENHHCLFLRGVKGTFDIVHLPYNNSTSARNSTNSNQHGNANNSVSNQIFATKSLFPSFSLPRNSNNNNDITQIESDEIVGNFEDIKVVEDNSLCSVTNSIYLLAKVSIKHFPCLESFQRNENECSDYYYDNESENDNDQLNKQFVSSESDEDVTNSDDEVDERLRLTLENESYRRRVKTQKLILLKLSRNRVSSGTPHSLLSFRLEYLSDLTFHCHKALQFEVCSGRTCNSLLQGYETSVVIFFMPYIEIHPLFHLSKTVFRMNLMDYFQGESLSVVKSTDMLNSSYHWNNTSNGSDANNNNNSNSNNFFKFHCSASSNHFIVSVTTSSDSIIHSDSMPLFIGPSINTTLLMYDLISMATRGHHSHNQSHYLFLHPRSDRSEIVVYDAYESLFSPRNRGTFSPIFGLIHETIMNYDNSSSAAASMLGKHVHGSSSHQFHYNNYYLIRKQIIEINAMKPFSLPRTFLHLLMEQSLSFENSVHSVNGTENNPILICDSYQQFAVKSRELFKYNGYLAAVLSSMETTTSPHGSSGHKSYNHDNDNNKNNNNLLFICSKLSKKWKSVNLKINEHSTLKLIDMFEYNRVRQSSATGHDASQYCSNIVTSNNNSNGTASGFNMKSLWNSKISFVFALNWFGEHSLLLFTKRKSRYYLELVSRESTNGLQSCPKLHCVLPLYVGFQVRYYHLTTTNTRELLLSLRIDANSVMNCFANANQQKQHQQHHSKSSSHNASLYSDIVCDEECLLAVVSDGKTCVGYAILTYLKDEKVNGSTSNEHNNDNNNSNTSNRSKSKATHNNIYDYKVVELWNNDFAGYRYQRHVAEETPDTTNNNRGNAHSNLSEMQSPLSESSGHDSNNSSSSNNSNSNSNNNGQHSDFFDHINSSDSIRSMKLLPVVNPSYYKDNNNNDNNKQSPYRDNYIHLLIVILLKNGNVFIFNPFTCQFYNHFTHLQAAIKQSALPEKKKHKKQNETRSQVNVTSNICDISVDCLHSRSIRGDFDHGKVSDETLLVDYLNKIKFMYLTMISHSNYNISAVKGSNSNVNTQASHKNFVWFPFLNNMSNNVSVPTNNINSSINSKLYKNESFSTVEIPSFASHEIFSNVLFGLIHYVEVVNDSDENNNKSNGNSNSNNNCDNEDEVDSNSLKKLTPRNNRKLCQISIHFQIFMKVIFEIIEIIRYSKMLKRKMAIISNENNESSIYNGIYSNFVDSEMYQKLAQNYHNCSIIIKNLIEIVFEILFSCVENHSIFEIFIENIEYRIKLVSENVKDFKNTYLEYRIILCILFAFDNYRINSAKPLSTTLPHVSMDNNSSTTNTDTNSNTNTNLPMVSLLLEVLSRLIRKLEPGPARSLFPVPLNLYSLHSSLRLQLPIFNEKYRVQFIDITQSLSSSETSNPSTTTTTTTNTNTNTNTISNSHDFSHFECQFGKFRVPLLVDINEGTTDPSTTTSSSNSSSNSSVDANSAYFRLYSLSPYHCFVISLKRHYLPIAIRFVSFSCESSNCELTTLESAYNLLDLQQVSTTQQQQQQQQQNSYNEELQTENIVFSLKMIFEIFEKSLHSFNLKNSIECFDFLFRFENILFAETSNQRLNSHDYREQHHQHDGDHSMDDVDVEDLIWIQLLKKYPNEIHSQTTSQSSLQNTANHQSMTVSSSSSSSSTSAVITNSNSNNSNSNNPSMIANRAPGVPTLPNNNTNSSNTNTNTNNSNSNSNTNSDNRQDYYNEDAIDNEVILNCNSNFITKIVNSFSLVSPIFTNLSLFITSGSSEVTNTMSSTSLTPGDPNHINHINHTNNNSNTINSNSNSNNNNRDMSHDINGNQQNTIQTIFNTFFYSSSNVIINNNNNNNNNNDSSNNNNNSNSNSNNRNRRGDGDIAIVDNYYQNLCFQYDYEALKTCVKSLQQHLISSRIDSMESTHSQSKHNYHDDLLNRYYMEHPSFFHIMKLSMKYFHEQAFFTSCLFMLSCMNSSNFRSMIRQAIESNITANKSTSSMEIGENLVNNDITFENSVHQYQHQHQYHCHAKISIVRRTKNSQTLKSTEFISINFNVNGNHNNSNNNNNNNSSSSNSYDDSDNDNDDNVNDNNSKNAMDISNDRNNNNNYDNNNNDNHHHNILEKQQQLMKDFHQMLSALLLSNNSNNNSNNSNSNNKQKSVYSMKNNVIDLDKSELMRSNNYSIHDIYLKYENETQNESNKLSFEISKDVFVVNFDKNCDVVGIQKLCLSMSLLLYLNHKFEMSLLFAELASLTPSNSSTNSNSNTNSSSSNGSSKESCDIDDRLDRINATNDPRLRISMLSAQLSTLIKRYFY